MKQIAQSALIVLAVMFASSYSCNAQNGPTQPQVIVTFTQSTTPGITGNCLYRSTTLTPVLPGTCSKVATTTLADAAPVAGTTYNYWVTAQANGSESAYSSPINVPVPANPNAPTGLAPLTVTENVKDKPSNIVAKVIWVDPDTTRPTR